MDNEKEDRKVDPSKFLKWLTPQIEGEGMYYLLLDTICEFIGLEKCSIVF